MSRFALLRPKPLSTRLWQGGGLLAAVVLTIVVANLFLSEEKAVGRKMLGHDFLAFYTAGTLVRDGQAELLYDLATSERVQRQIGVEQGLELGKGFGPFWNPPFYAWTFVGLAALPYGTAVGVWVTINLCCAAIAVALLARIVISAAAPFPQFSSGTSWKYWALVPLLLCVSMPFLQAISHAQNTCISLLLLTLVVTQWRARRALSAGIVCGLLFYKPQLATVVAGVLCLTLGRRAVAGLAITGAFLLAVTLFTLPGSLSLYLSQLPLNLAAMQVEAPYLWERHVTLKAFWRLLFQGAAPGEMSPAAAGAWIATWLLVAGGLAWAAWRWLGRDRSDVAFDEVTAAVRLDRLIAATIVTMPLLMPFYFDYDLLLLAIPLTLLSAERLRGGEQIQGRDRTLVKVASMLFAWLMFNPGVARMGGVNVSVVLLGVTAMLFITRAAETRRTAGGEDADAEEQKPIRLDTQPVPRPLAA
jgi:alpha-1,2-mannosyltransferase